MVKDKYDFIQEILNNHKLNSTQRERILLLTSEEIKRDKQLGNFLEKRIIRLENVIGVKEDVEISNELEETKIKPSNFNELFNELLGMDSNINPLTDSQLPKYIHPSSLYKYLFEYNQNEVLKSTCHEVDADALEIILEYCDTEEYDFEKHLDKIVSSFEKHDKKYFCSPTTKAFIRGYITGKDYMKNDLKSGWSTDKIEINWATSELLNWSTKYKIPPNCTLGYLKENKMMGFGFDDFTSGLFDKRVQTFRELVLHFKNLFHIRTDNSLKSILIKNNDRKFFSDKIDFEISEESFPSKIELFTDVDKLITAYIKVVDLILEQHPIDSKPIVHISLSEAGSSVFLSIHHLNNKYKKTIQNTIERMGQTYTNLVKRQLNGMCNLYLRADFDQEGIAEINLWNGTPRVAIRENLHSFKGGVEHVFEFCKKD